jgi:hypothetical protein
MAVSIMAVKNKWQAFWKRVLKFTAIFNQPIYGN